MAGEFLRSRGIDIDAEMARIQNDPDTRNLEVSPNPARETVECFRDVSIPRTGLGSRWDVAIQNGIIQSITPHDPQTPPENQGRTHIDCHTALLSPSLCHPHIHIDKAYLLSHPKYAHLQIKRGDFAEAMDLTSAAKSQFEDWDLLERGRRVIDESVAAGVTHMRAFVEVDAAVQMKCLNAGIQLKDEAERQPRCLIQLCAFAQLPLFSSSEADEDGNVIRGLMGEAARRPGVQVLGSTPYVESNRAYMKINIEWMVDLSIEHDMHLDFHLDYNVKANTEPLIWHVISTLKKKDWKASTSGKTVVLGHCTRITLFRDDELRRLKEEIGDLPIFFVGLPTSDLFMMRTPERARTTLDIPALIKDDGFNACLGINNIGNAFTPHGSCDPLTLACNGVGIYSAGTMKDAELLYECVSTRARKAIGLSCEEEDEALRVGDRADLVLFGRETEEWRTRKTVAEAVYLYDHCRERQGFIGGLPTSEREEGG